MAAWFRNWRKTLGRWSGWPAVVGGCLVGLVLSGVRWVGAFQPLELALYDQMLRWRPAEPPDPRVLVVAITEADIQRLGQWPLRDAVLATALQRLLAARPRVIGLDLYRDIPQPPGTADLRALLTHNNAIIAVCKLGDRESPGIPPPPGMDPGQVGFADILVDAGGTVRRALLGVQPDPNAPCPTSSALAVQAALRYLAPLGIQPRQRPDKTIILGRGVFPPLTPRSGPYQGLDNRGYQILLNYRGARQAVAQVTLGEVLAQQVSPALIRDRLVLVGTTAASAKDTFYTPYSAGLADDQKMAGVVIHAQIASQLISAALDGRPLIWYWPQGWETLWIWFWAGLGGLLGWRLRHPWHLALGLAGGVLGLGGIAVALFRLGGWIPLAPPLVGLVTATMGVVAYTAYQTDRQYRQVAAKAAQQQEYITQLQTLLAATQTTEIVPPTQLGTGPLAGRYRIERVLGQGGFGRTYLAYDTHRSGEFSCVVKQLRPARTDAQFLEVARRLFRTEAEILEVLGQHPQIPTLLDYFEENQEFYLVQEYIEGTGLHQELEPGQKHDEAYTLALLRGILEVLVFVHAHRVIHRDIKPANLIRRAKDQRLVLIDFGAVKQLHPFTREDQTGDSTVPVGTKGYAPSEQMAGRPQLNSDLYAVGMIAIQALTGKLPRDLELHPDTGLPIWRPYAQVSPRLADILDKMVAYFYTERYQTAAEVLRDLQPLL